MILDKPLKRIRQIIAAIAEQKLAEEKERRLIVSWQTRALAMVIAKAGMNESQELMEFASRLTIDREEYEQFGHQESEVKSSAPKSKLRVHATTQEQAVKENLAAAAERNNSDMLALFGNGLERGKPGH
jgi:hypothetical protein